MINKIIASTIFVSCLFAILLSINNIEGPIWFGNQFRSFIVSCNRELENFKIEIPNLTLLDIGDAPSIDESPVIWVVLWNIGNFFVSISNFLIPVLNVVISFLNVAIQLIQFAYVFIKNIGTLKDMLISLSA